MPNNSPSSKTIRIDLIAGAGHRPRADQEPHGAASLLRSGLSMKHRLPSSVARSRYQELLQSVYDAALITTVTGSIIDANVRAIEFLLYEKAELCNLGVHDLIAGADQSLMDTLCENLKRERFTLIQAYCLRRDGTSFPAEIAVNKLRLDDLCLCFFIRDTTLRTQAEESLRIEHSAIQNAGNGIVIADLDARLEYANPAFARMLGFERPDDLVGQDMAALFPENPAADELIQSVAREHESRKTEMTVRKTTGEEIYVQVSVACSRNAEGQPDGLVFSFADVTAHRAMEQALRNTQADLENRVAERTVQLQSELAEHRRTQEALQARIAELERALRQKS
jgi:PAS domain S-box-containing protein